MMFQSSELHDQPILRSLAIHIVHVTQHVIAHVGQNHTLDADFHKMRFESREIEVKRNVLVAKVSLRNKQVKKAFFAAL